LREIKIAGPAVSGGGEDLTLQQGLEATLTIDLSVEQHGEPACLHVTITDQAETAVMTYLLVDDVGSKLRYPAGNHQITIDLGRTELNSGRYSVQVGAEGAASERILYLGRGLSPFTVVAEHNHWAKLVRNVVLQRLD
jgi:hypothetical protein